jgi:hypothetical protein
MGGATMFRQALMILALIFATAVLGQSGGIEQASTGYPGYKDKAMACTQAMERAETSANVKAASQGGKASVTKKSCDCSADKDGRFTCVAFVSWEFEKR